MIFGTVLWNNQCKNQIDWFSIVGVKGQGFDQLQEQHLNPFGIADTTVRYGNTIAECGAAQVFTGTETFENFP